MTLQAFYKKENAVKTGKKYDASVVLLSGGLDSTTTLSQAIKDSGTVSALSFDYQQRHKVELHHAYQIVNYYKEHGVKINHYIQDINLRLWGGSALTSDIPVPQDTPIEEMGSSIPPTYVPARNTVFLAFGLSLAEATEADAIWIGANALDYSGYPDCRPEFFEWFQNLANVATRRGVEGNYIEIVAPLLHLNKREIIELGQENEAPLALSWSCYSPQYVETSVENPEGLPVPCGRCDSCQLRAKGFLEARVPDPAY
jgi:7-cyano-7-deazaguanine synthase